MGIGAKMVITHNALDKMAVSVTSHLKMIITHNALNKMAAAIVKAHDFSEYCVH